MSLISAKEQATLRQLFAGQLREPVTITYFTQRASPLLVPGHECQFCAETRALLKEVSALSEKLPLAVKDFVADAAEAQALGLSRIPAFVLAGQARGRVRYFGIPSGYEFSTLIEGLIGVSTGATVLSSTTRGILRDLDREVHVQVFVTPTCPYCALAARRAHQLAIESERITADVIEITEFPDLAQRHQVYAVPKTVITVAPGGAAEPAPGGQVEFDGAVPEAELMRRLAEALGAAVACVGAEL